LSVKQKLKIYVDWNRRYVKFNIILLLNDLYLLINNRTCFGLKWWLSSGSS